MYHINTNLHYSHINNEHLIDWLCKDGIYICLINNGLHGFQILMFRSNGYLYNCYGYLTLEQGKEAFKKYKPKHIILFEDQ